MARAMASIEAKLASSSSQNKASRMAAGNAMFALNQRGLSKNDQRLKAVKGCVDKAVWSVFPGGHAQVQLQGSTAKGTALQGRSDWDFFVHLDNTIVAVTSRQRKQVHDMLLQYLSAAGFIYEIRIAEKRLQLRFGSCDGAALPGADVVFERFKNHPPATAPQSQILASSHAGQNAARYIKNLPSYYSNLRTPKRVEELVAQVESYLRCQRGYKKDQLLGARGFDEVVTAALQAVLGMGDMQDARAVQTAVQNAGLLTNDWRCAAQRVLNQKKAGNTWPGL